MDEEITDAAVELVKKAHKHEIAVVVLGALAGYGATQLTKVVYEKMVVEGRLQRLINRNK